ncbi:hypothetical protein FB446DRAFT_110875 [Lentinula raphanica]|nr:hypothetical protein FB446DRAFT_110875 [Lentinula raphanica]
MIYPQPNVRVHLFSSYHIRSCTISEKCHEFLSLMLVPLNSFTVLSPLSLCCTMHFQKQATTQDLDSAPSTHKRPFAVSVNSVDDSHSPSRLSAMHASKKIKRIYENGAQDSQITSQAWVERLYHDAGQSTYLGPGLQASSQPEVLGSTQSPAAMRVGVIERREFIEVVSDHEPDFIPNDSRYMKHTFFEPPKQSIQKLHPA